MRRQSRAARVFAACALFSLGAHGQTAAGDSAAGEIRAEPEVQPASAIVAAPKARLADPARIAHVILDRPALAAVNKAAVAGKPGAPLQIGFGRPVPDLASAPITVDRLLWSPAPRGGRVAAFSVTSPGALAIRAGLRFDSLPAGTLLRFYPQGEGEVFEITAQDVRETIGRNLDAGGRGNDATTFWSPVIEGSTAVVEIELAAGVSPAALALAAPAVSHLLTAPSIDFSMPSAKAAASCNVDVSCYSTWSSESNSVARITFVDGGSSYLCTGTLVADRDTSTSIPFFLTANHCIATQASASSMVSYWFYRSTACDSGVRGVSKTLSGGATLLYNSANTDTSLLRLNAAPPAGAVYAGWSVGGSVPLGAGVAGLHNPTGDMQKISFGSVTGNTTCASTSSESFTCRKVSAALGTFYEVSWDQGTTEPGSSGAGLFLENGHYLLGQLFGGTTSCTSPGSDYFGRFDVAYNAGVSAFLNGGSATPAPPAPAGPTTFVPALDYSALWWNPAESGWGLSVTQHTSNNIFAAWYLYEPGGNARWMVVPGGAWTSPTTFTGELFSTSGPLPDQAWSPISTQRVGTATLTFAGANAGVLSYTVNGVSGTKPIQRQPFGVPDATPVASYGDLWWNSSESGWGLAINQQYRTLFAIWYTYGIYGQPVWYVMPGGSWSGDTYSGTLYRTSTAPLQFFTAPFDPRLVSSAPVGSMSLRFGSTTSATMTSTVDGVTASRAITRQPF